MVESSRSRVDALFAEALDQPVAERTAFLARTCAGDEDLLEEVTELLRLAAEPVAGLEAGAGTPGALLRELFRDLEAAPGPRREDERIGPWRLDGPDGVVTGRSDLDFDARGQPRSPTADRRRFRSLSEQRWAGRPPSIASVSCKSSAPHRFLGTENRR